jgi:hypothetical protein
MSQTVPERPIKRSAFVLEYNVVPRKLLKEFPSTTHLKYKTLGRNSEPSTTYNEIIDLTLFTPCNNVSLNGVFSEMS